NDNFQRGRGCRALHDLYLQESPSSKRSTGRGVRVPFGKRDAGGAFSATGRAAALTNSDLLGSSMAPNPRRQTGSTFAPRTLVPLRVTERDRPANGKNERHQAVQCREMRREVPTFPTKPAAPARAVLAGAAGSRILSLHLLNPTCPSSSPLSCRLSSPRRR